MPNFCENVVVFKCEDAALINTLRDKCVDGELFQYIKSGPDENEWRLENWGTRTEALFPRICVEVALMPNERWEFECGFETAWGPPVEIMKHALEKWPTLSVELAYYEPGLAFCGLYEGGDEPEHWQLEDVDLESEEAIEKSLEHLPERLVERLMLKERFILDMRYEQELHELRWSRLDAIDESIEEDRIHEADMMRKYDKEHGNG